MIRKELISSSQYWITQFHIQLYSTFINAREIVDNKERRLRQTTLAKRTEYAPSQISDWINGVTQPSIEVYVKLLIAMEMVPKITIENLKDQK